MPEMITLAPPLPESHSGLKSLISHKMTDPGGLAMGMWARCARLERAYSAAAVARHHQGRPFVRSFIRSFI